MESRIAYTKQTKDGRTITFRFVETPYASAHVQAAIDGVDFDAPQSYISTIAPVQGYTKAIGKVVLSKDEANALQAILDAETMSTPKGLLQHRQELEREIVREMDAAQYVAERRHASEDFRVVSRQAMDTARTALATFDAAHPEIVEMAKTAGETAREAHHIEAQRLIAAGV